MQKYQNIMDWRDVNMKKRHMSLKQINEAIGQRLTQNKLEESEQKHMTPLQYVLERDAAELEETELKGES